MTRRSLREVWTAGLSSRVDALEERVEVAEARLVDDDTTLLRSLGVVDEHGRRLALDRAARRRVVRQLHARGLSDRRIAGLLEVDHRTVAHDRASQPSPPPGGEDSPPGGENSPPGGENSPPQPPGPAPSTKAVRALVREARRPAEFWAAATPQERREALTAAESLVEVLTACLQGTGDVEPQASDSDPDR